MMQATKQLRVSGAACFAVSCEQADAVELDMKSNYLFDITVYSNENFGRIVELFRRKGRGHSWCFFDPEDLANEALRKLWTYTVDHPDCCRDKAWIDKVVSTIIVRIWIDEVRRELKKGNLSGKSIVCVSLFCGLNMQVADICQDFDVKLRELLDYVKAALSPRQKRIVELRMENRDELEIALKLKVSESTIDKEIVSISKKIVSILQRTRPTTNDQRPTLNAQRSTLNAQRSTLNEVATRVKEIVPNYSKIFYASCEFSASLVVVEANIVHSVTVRISANKRNIGSKQAGLLVSATAMHGFLLEKKKMIYKLTNSQAPIANQATPVWLFLDVVLLAASQEGCGPPSDLAAKIESGNSNSSIPYVIDVGIVFANEASYFCVPLSQLGIADSSEVLSVDSSCECAKDLGAWHLSVPGTCRSWHLSVLG